MYSAYTHPVGEGLAPPASMGFILPLGSKRENLCLFYALLYKFC